MIQPTRNVDSYSGLVKVSDVWVGLSVWDNEVSFCVPFKSHDPQQFFCLGEGLKSFGNAQEIVALEILTRLYRTSHKSSRYFLTVFGLDFDLRRCSVLLNLGILYLNLKNPNRPSMNR